MKREKLTIIILAIIAVLAVGYIVMANYSASKQQKELTLYQAGAQYGAEAAILQIIQQASTCQQVPLYYRGEGQNITINLIAVECLQAAAQQQASK